MRMLVATLLAIEGEEDQTPRVEGRKQRRNDQHPEAIPVTRRIGALDDRVFRQEPGKADGRAKEGKDKARDTHTGDRQRTQHHRPEGIGDLLAQVAVVHHVLLVMHRMDHRTGAKEQQRLEERVREQVEHRRRIHANTGRHEHIAQLRTGRIGNHALDVGLNQTHGRRKERRGGTQNRDERCRLGRVFIERRHTADQEHTCRHHGCRVDQRRNRGRAFHRVGQPGVQHELR